jgi:hypothetical protein
VVALGQISVVCVSEFEHRQLEAIRSERDHHGPRSADLRCTLQTSVSPSHASADFHLPYKS